MTCTEVKKLLYDYTKGETSPSETAGIEDHIASCSGCSAELMSTRNLKKMFMVSLLDVPAAVLRNLRRRFGWKPAWHSLLRPAFAFTALILIATGVFMYTSSRRDEKDAALSNFIEDNYGIVQTSLYDNSDLDIEDTSYLVNQDSI